MVIIVDSVLTEEPAPSGQNKGLQAQLTSWWRNLRKQYRRRGWFGWLTYGLGSARLHMLTAFIGLLLCAWFVVALVQIAAHFSVFNRGGNVNRSGISSYATRSLTPTHPPSPTATSTIPVQTELDGVITIQNLDAQNPFDGTVHVSANNGQWFCRNAPLSNSTWQIHLEPGATISLPCIIPVSTPSSLPPHTFRAAVPGANNQGLALVDNPAPFAGASYEPTPGS